MIGQLAKTGDLTPLVSRTPRGIHVAIRCIGGISRIIVGHKLVVARRRIDVTARVVSLREKHAEHGVKSGDGFSGGQPRLLREVIYRLVKKGGIRQGPAIGGQSKKGWSQLD